MGFLGEADAPLDVEGEITTQLGVEVASDVEEREASADVAKSTGDAEDGNLPKGKRSNGKPVKFYRKMAWSTIDSNEAAKEVLLRILVGSSGFAS